MRASPEANALMTQQKQAFASVDDFCNEHRWAVKEHVLLSLTAMNVDALSELEIHAICALLTSSERERSNAAKLLLKLQNARKQFY